MFVSFWNWFVKITAWPAWKIVFRTVVTYEESKERNCRIRGAAIIISNHTSVFDYVLYLMLFFSRTVRVQMAEVLFKKPLLRVFLKMMGGILVDRQDYDLSIMEKSERILEKGGVVGIFPEGRLPLKGEDRPLPFKTGVAHLALRCDVPVIPMYTDGNYFKRGKNRVIIGKPFCAREYVDDNMSERDILRTVADKLRERLMELEKMLNE